MATHNEIESILTRHVAEFPGATDEEKHRDLAATLAKITSALTLPMEDRREAAKFAIEAPKLFITIALAAIVAIAALAQLGWNTFIKSNNLVLILCLAAGTACFFSMYFGLLAINRVSKAGLQIENRWTLERLKGVKNLQALIGVFAIILFLTAVSVSVRDPAPSAAITIELPGVLQASLPKGIVASGTWTQLRLDGGNGASVNLDPVPTGQTRSFEIRSK
jgi:hypothetical protein